MANLYLYLDTRKPRKDGTCPLKIVLTHNRKAAYSLLDIDLLPDEWDDEHKQVVGRADKKFQNVFIKKRMAECTLAFQRIMLREDFARLDSRQILDMVVRGTDTANEPGDGDYLIPAYNEYITLCRKPSTAASYRASLKNLMEYCSDIDSLRFKDINVAWLRKYQNWLLDERKMSVNGANVYLRNLRTVFNSAIMNQYTYARYPFRDIDMSTAEPDKRYVEWGVFLDWVSYPVTDFRQMYRELFLLSFYLCGIRPVDLLHVKSSQVVDGRLVYWPEKLNGRTKLSIKIEPEAWEIINKYRGDEYLLNIMENRKDYKAFMQHWNRALKAIGPDETYEKTGKRGRAYMKVRHNGVIPFITIYYSRTFWGSFCYNVLGVSMDTISQGFGHKSGLKVTNFYVKRGDELVDKTNRDLIDRLKKDLDERKAGEKAG